MVCSFVLFIVLTAPYTAWPARPRVLYRVVSIEMGQMVDKASTDRAATVKEETLVLKAEKSVQTKDIKVKNCEVQTEDDNRLNKCAVSINRKNRLVESYKRGLDRRDQEIRRLRIEVDEVTKKLQRSDRELFEQNKEIKFLKGKLLWLDTKAQQQNDSLMEMNRKKEEEINVRNKVRIEEERYRMKRELDVYESCSGPKRSRVLFNSLN